MISINSRAKIHESQAPLGKSNKISSVLNKYLLHVLLEFCGFETKHKFRGVNRKFKEAYYASKLIGFFLEE